MYPTLCKQAFGLFTCYFLDDERYLLADLEETCYEGRHLAYVFAVGVPQLIIFVAGLPILGLYFLHRNRDNLDATAVKARYGIFFGGYKKEKYYWEAVLIFRKVAVILVSSFGTTMNPEMQVLMLNLILMCCYAAQQIGQPYEILGMTRVRHRILPGLELSALAMLLLTLWSGLVMFMLDKSSDSADKTVHEILSGVTVFANVVYVLYLFFILVRQILHEKRKEGSAVVAKLDQVLARIRSSSSSVNTASDVDPTLGIELPPMNGEDGEDGEDVDDKSNESNEVEEADEVSSGRVNPMFQRAKKKKSRRKKNPSAEPVAALSAAEMKLVEQAEEEEEEANQQHQIDIPADLTSSEDISEEL